MGARPDQTHRKALFCLQKTCTAGKPGQKSAAYVSRVSGEDLTPTPTYIGGVPRVASVRLNLTRPSASTHHRRSKQSDSAQRTVEQTAHGQNQTRADTWIARRLTFA